MSNGMCVRDLSQTRVLVVDASEFSRPRQVHELGRFVGGVEAVATGSQALLRICTERFDGVILDPCLPDIDGMELMELLRERRPDLAIVVVTGVGSIASCVRAIKLGAADYLLKPIDGQTLADALAGEHVRPADRPAPAMSLDRLAWEHIQRVLDESRGNISEAARRLRIHRQSLQRKLRKPPPYRDRA